VASGSLEQAISDSIANQKLMISTKQKLYESALKTHDLKRRILEAKQNLADQIELNFEITKE